MYKKLPVCLGGFALLLLEGCATTPMGPTVQVLPAANEPFSVFQQDQAGCEQYAKSQVAGQADAANRQAIGSTLIGAALGGGLGGATDGGSGAGVGAAAGGTVGAVVGADGTANAQQSIQQQYDQAYGTCMYSKGDQVVGIQYSNQSGAQQ
ncbi:glycine zipper family protein [Acidocella sp.]|jgi:uncharacterized protein YcfJ|uniref:glycine zipper family protein n=1 Tax=Acidocella sp. TaxID=50710 RepID=UPI002F3F715E